MISSFLLGWYYQLKGMVKVPNVIGQNKNTATANILNAHLTNTGNTTENTSDQNLNDTVKSTNPPADTLVDNETNVSYVNYVFSFSPFSVFGFSPFGVFSFSPFSVFSFSPFSVFSFSPFSVFGFSPGGGCIDEDTLIQVVGPSETELIAYKKAKDIQVGDIVYSALWDELVDESINADPSSMISETATNLHTVTTTIMDITPSTKNITIYLNNDLGKRFSIEEYIYVKRGNIYTFILAGALEIGDYIIEKIDNDTYQETEIINISSINEDRTVYRFNAEPVDTIIAGNIIVHNIKPTLNF